MGPARPPQVELLLRLQRTVGNQAVGALLRSYRAQRTALQAVTTVADSGLTEAATPDQPHELAQDAPQRPEPAATAHAIATVQRRSNARGATGAHGAGIPDRAARVALRDRGAEAPAREAGDEAPAAVGGVVRRIPGGGSAPPAQPQVPGKQPGAPGAAPGGAGAIVHEGVVLTPDSAATRQALETRVTLKGWDDTYGWATRFINMDMQQELKYQLAGADVKVLKDARATLNSEIDRMQEEVKKLIPDFEKQANASTEELLANSEKQIKAQLATLGVHETFFDKVLGTHSIDEKKGKALQDAARELAARRRETDKATREYLKARGEIDKVTNATPAPSLAAAMPQLFVPQDLIQRVETLRKAGMAMEEDYARLCQVRQQDNPILAAYTTGSDAAERLEGLARQSQGDLAETVVTAAQEKLDNIKEVRGELGKRFTVWDQPHIMGIAKQQMKAVNWQSRVLDDNAGKVHADKNSSKMLFAVIAIGLGLLAAIPTGGSSLIAGVAVAAAATGAAMSIYGAYEHYQEYNLESAAQATDFDKAKAISQGDPPDVFWLAVDVVTAIADVKAAMTAYKTLKGLLDAARAARAGEGTAELLEAARKYGLSAEAQSKMVAAATGGKPGQVAKTLEEIKAVFVAAKGGVVDADLAVVFHKAAEKAIAQGKVAMIAGDAVEQRRAVIELLRNNAKPGYAIGKTADRLLEKMKTANGLYVSDLDIILVKGDRSAESVAATLAHELAHQRQHMVLGLENMHTLEMEYQAFYAQQRFLMQLPVDQVPQEYAWLLKAGPEDIKKHVLLNYPKAKDGTGLWFTADMAADEILTMLKGR